MKVLHLIRHAKSSWDNPLLGDIERPLKKRGRSDAQLVAPAAFAAGWRANSVYCSSATRARQTIVEWTAALQQGDGDVHYVDALYTFDYRHLIDWLIHQRDSELSIVGHNPALLELIEWFSAEPLPKFPTCAYCQLEFDIKSWQESSRGTGKIVSLITPKMLKPA
jgi:phosphohistidine phosphatase